MNAMSKPEGDAIAGTQQLRRFLLNHIQGVANGQVDAEKAKSISNLSQQVYNTLNIEVKIAKAKAEGVDIKPVQFDE